MHRINVSPARHQHQVRGAPSFPHRFPLAPDIPLGEIVWKVLPFVGLMAAAVLLLCLFPEIATGLPTWIYARR